MGEPFTTQLKNSNQHSESGAIKPELDQAPELLPASYTLGELTAAPVGMAENLLQDRERRGAAFAAAVPPRMSSPEGILVQHAGGATPSLPKVCVHGGSAFPPDT